MQRAPSGPVAIETKLGLVLSGPDAISGQTDVSHSFVMHTSHISAPTPETQTLDDTMKSFWKLESFGILSTDRSLYDDTSVFRNRRYEVQLPWKMPQRDLSNDLSLKRLNGLLCWLKHESNILAEYDTMIKTQLEQRIVEPVDNQLSVDIPDVHYLPHHAVVHKDKANPALKFDQKILDILSHF